jgi:hypothetical protein
VTSEPVWLRPVVAALHEILGLPEGWNSYRARRIEGQAAITALQLLLDTMQPTTPPPSVVPTFPGGIQLEWHLHGMDLEVEITPALRIEAACEDEITGEEWEADLTADSSRLQQTLAMLAGRS